VSVAGAVTARVGRPAGLPGAAAGCVDSGRSAGVNVAFWEGWVRVPGPWTAVRYAELPPGAAEAGPADSREQVWLVVSGSGLAELDGDRRPAGAGDVVTCPAGAACSIRVPETATQPMALLAVEAFPGSPQPRSGPRRIPLAAKLAGCAGYRGGEREQDTLVAVARLEAYLTGRWHRLSLILIEPDGILGKRTGPRAAEGYRRPYNSSEILFTMSGAAEITVGAVTAENKDSPGRKLCVGVPPSETVLVRNLSVTQPLLVASIEMGVPA
jgi:quercetin dioxygenase-like cupin family protein